MNTSISTRFIKQRNIIVMKNSNSFHVFEDNLLIPIRYRRNDRLFISLKSNYTIKKLDNKLILLGNHNINIKHINN